jgi:hypothetical protein
MSKIISSYILRFSCKPSILASFAQLFSLLTKRVSLDCVAFAATSLSTVVLFLTLSVIQYAHPVWQDEVQIIDYGRSILDQSTKWSISWDWINGVPVLNASNYLGCFLQGSIFGLSAFNILGPRIFSLLGGIVCSFSLYYLLRTLGVQPNFSVVTSSAYLLHPSFFNSFLADRVDSWSISFGIISCFIIARFCFSPTLTNKQILIYSLVAGCAASFGFSFWLTFPVLTPLFLATFFSCKAIYPTYCFSSYFRRFITVIIFFLVGFVLVQGLLFFPIFLSGSLEGYKSTAFAVLRDKPVHDSFTESLKALLNISFPNMFALALFIIFVLKSLLSDRREISLSFLFAFFFGSLCIALFSRVYSWRVVYLLPSLYVFIGTSVVPAISSPHRGVALSLRFRLISAIALFIISFSFSMQKVTSFLPILNGSSRYAISSLFEIARTNISDKTSNVLVGAVEFYPVGRRKSWHMYPLPIDINKARELISSKQDQFDCIILDSKSNLAEYAVEVLRHFVISKVETSSGDYRDGYSNYLIAVKELPSREADMRVGVS